MYYFEFNNLFGHYEFVELVEFVELYEFVDLVDPIDLVEFKCFRMLGVQFFACL
jgi:hypothetical protein